MAVWISTLEQSTRQDDVVDVFYYDFHLAPNWQSVAHVPIELVEHRQLEQTWRTSVRERFNLPIEALRDGSWRSSWVSFWNDLSPLAIYLRARAAVVLESPLGAAGAVQPTATANGAIPLENVGALALGKAGRDGGTSFASVRGNRFKFDVSAAPPQMASWPATSMIHVFAMTPAYDAEDCRKRVAELAALVKKRDATSGPSQANYQSRIEWAKADMRRANCPPSVVSDASVKSAVPDAFAWRGTVRRGLVGDDGKLVRDLLPCWITIFGSKKFLMQRADDPTDGYVLEWVGSKLAVRRWKP